MHAVLPSFAQVPETPTPTPTPSEQLTPTPTDSSQSNLDEQVVTEDNATEEGTIVVSPDGVEVTNTGDLADIEVTDTTTLSTNIENTNNADVTRNIDTTNNTGDNTLTDNIGLNGNTNTIVTGDAETVQNITTVVNTNVVAQSAAIVLKDVYGTNNGTIDLSTIAPCYAAGDVTTPEVFNIENTGNNVKLVDTDNLDSEFVVRNDNTATITNNIDLTSNTGDNSAIGNISSGTSVDTGDASTELNLFTMANTNLVGNCYFYGVINLFGTQNGDIILPYELGILQNGLSPLAFRSPSGVTNTGDNATIDESNNTKNELIVKNANNADVNENLESSANTGNNSLIDTINFDMIGSIVTGNASDEKNVIDIINTNYVANNFFILLINRYGNWNGQVVGLDSSYMIVPATYNPTAPRLYSTAIVNTGDELGVAGSNNIKNTVVVENNNNLSLDNNILLTSNTGDNEAGRFNASINTGDAQTKANVVTIGNTNIIGDNWFFAVINIFDDFFGNIVFPRPELMVQKMVDQASHNAGDVFNYTIGYGNFGNVYTDQVVLTDNVHPDLEVVSTTGGAVVSGNTITWNVGRLDPNQSGMVTVTVRSKSDLSSQDIPNTVSVTSSRVESNYDNNSSTAVVHIFARGNNNSSSIPTTVVNNAVSPLGGSILPTGASTSMQVTKGAVKGLEQTVAKGKSKINGKSADCGTSCQVESLKTDQSILTVLALLLALLIGVKKRYIA